MKRREFLQKSATAGLAVAALPAMFNGISVEALADGEQSRMLQKMAGDSDRIFVLIQLNGGNDGLNTVIPFEDSLYYAARPSIGISTASSLKISDSVALHPAMSGFKKMFDDKQLSIVQGVTYPNPNRSHFRGTDIWLAATDADVYKSTGWVGRYLEAFLPQNFPQVVPDHPLAVQIGSSLSMTFQSTNGSAGITFRTPDEFYNLVRDSGGSGGTNGSFPNTPAGMELAYIQSVQQSAQTYSSVIKKAGDNGEKEYSAKSNAPYPSTDLARKLKIVAQLIAGGLQTKFYLVSLNGFDTHIQQGSDVGAHAALLSELSGGVSAFLTDVQKLGYEDNVVGITFSEFGRRVAENGSKGTDHGTAAPLFVFGKKINGGKIFGDNPSLKPENLDSRGDIVMQFDYRQIYSAALMQWFGASTTRTKLTLLGNEFAALPLFEEFPATSIDDFSNPNAGSFSFSLPTPNPANDICQFSYRLPSSASVNISLLSVAGERCLTIVNREQESGTYPVQFDVSRLPVGTYFLEVRLGRRSELTMLTVIK